jgi:hypothetical protein
MVAWRNDKRVTRNCRCSNAFYLGQKEIHHGACQNINAEETRRGEVTEKHKENSE